MSNDFFDHPVLNSPHESLPMRRMLGDDRATLVPSDPETVLSAQLVASSELVVLYRKRFERELGDESMAPPW